MDANDNIMESSFQMFEPDGVIAPIQTPIEEPVPQQQPVQQNVQQPVQQNVEVAKRIPKNQQNTVQQNNGPMPMPQQPVGQPLPNRTDGSTLQNLAILMNVKPYYTDTEWMQKFTLYGDECAKIGVDAANLTSSDITVNAGRIDALLTPVRLDYANIQGRLAVLELQCKVIEQDAFKQVYDGFVAKNAKMPAIDDRKAMATFNVENYKMQEDGLNVYELRQRYSARAIQIESIVKILQDKKDLLITYSAALKLENTTNNFTASVPTDRQMNQMRS